MEVFTTYDTLDDMMQSIQDASQSADESVTEQQQKYRPGDIVMSDSGYGFPIFHDIIDIEKMVKDNFKKYGDNYEEEGIYLLDHYR